MYKGMNNKSLMSSRFSAEVRKTWLYLQWHSCITFGTHTLLCDEVEVETMKIKIIYSLCDKVIQHKKIENILIGYNWDLKMDLVHTKKL